MRVLVVDDDEKLCDVVKRGLEEDSYAVDCVYDGDDGEYYAETTSYDLIILDIMMPKKNGIEVCRNLRRKNIKTPILMLTAKDTVEDRVKGLDTGADDYLIKPFAFGELTARVRALLRRESTSKSLELKVGDLVLNTSLREASWKQRPVDLTTKEYAILEYLMRHPNAVITRTMIETHAWDYELDSISNLVDVYIRRIRQKIDPEQGKNIIQTVRGAGYRIRAL
ncbi:MAG: response regulator transcription factor [Deltaproteobacteria bacterium]|nr:response regulator transcription factor [Deltaproteobacteria bacterium]